ncbi:MAG: hypothetical protein AB7F65_07480 [Dehalococcoidia bacterium]
MEPHWESFIGLAAVPAALPVLVEHLKRAVAVEGRSPWPLVTDFAAVAWVLGLWSAGLLGTDGAGPALPTVLLLGLVTGVAASLGYDGWRRLRDGTPGRGAPESD